MSSNSPYLLIINGAPGVGKTTLAKRLHKDLGIGLVSKDLFKEFLFDTVGTGDREWSFLLGKEVIQFCYHFAKLSIQNKRSVVFESAFFVEYARGDMREIIEQTHVRPLELYCSLDESERQRRFGARIESGERHIGHADSISETAITNIEKYAPLDVCQRITIDTGAFGDAEYDKLLSSIKEFVKGGTI